MYNVGHQIQIGGTVAVAAAAADHCCNCRAGRKQMIYTVAKYQEWVSCEADGGSGTPHVRWTNVVALATLYEKQKAVVAETSHEADEGVTSREMRHGAVEEAT